MPLKETNFLCWNLRGRAADEELVNIIGDWSIDVLLLTESPYVEWEEDLINLLNRRSAPTAETFHSVQPRSDIEDRKVQIISRLPRRKYRRKFLHGRYEGWELASSSGVKLLLVGAHFPDVRYEQGDGQRKTAIELRQDIEEYVRRLRVPSSASSPPDAPLIVITGDLNASPFDPGIMGFYGLNASGHRAIVEGHGSRTLGGQTVDFLYNPMWKFLGDTTTPGTWYHRLSTPICCDWYVLDQVIVSAGILPYLNNDDVQILTRDTVDPQRGLSFLKNGKPNSDKSVTDHLPLIFRLAL